MITITSSRLFINITTTKVLTAVLLLILWASHATAIDIDFLGIQHKSVSAVRSDGGSILRDVKELLPRDSVLGLLDYSFGDSLDPVRYLLDSGKIRAVRVHYLNGSGVRNGLAAIYEPTVGLRIATFNSKILTKDVKILDHLTARVKLWGEMMKNYPHIKWLVSPVLESDLSNQAFGVLAQTAINATKTPFTLVVSSGIQSPEIKPTWIREGHGQGPWPKNVKISSTDGLDIMDTTMGIWKPNTKNHIIKFIWNRKFNGRNNGPWVDPRARVTWPKREELVQILHVQDVQPDAPKAPAVLNGIKCIRPENNGKRIWKPLAEDTGTNDPRANLPVLITTGNSGGYNLIGAQGKVAGKLGYFDRFGPDLQRYYSGWRGGSGLNGYQFQQEALKQGSPWVWAVQGNQCFGPFLPGRRQGNARP